MTPVYLETARLMTRVAPWVFAGGAFALKGGTAINLFVRDLPRLSVDLDLVLIDHRLDRSAALATIDAALRDAAQRLARRGFDVHTARTDGADGTKLFVHQGRVEVKVEVNGVLRGTVHPVRVMSLTARARDILAADVALPVVSSADLYGGKLVAALDRQHPRDLFDVMELYRNEGLTPEIRRAFVVYLASHNRPMHEVLAPTPRDIDLKYRSSFNGMTAEPVDLEDLLVTRERLIAHLRVGLDADERAFLSIVRKVARAAARASASAPFRCAFTIGGCIRSKPSWEGSRRNCLVWPDSCLVPRRPRPKDDFISRFPRWYPFGYNAHGPRHPQGPPTADRRRGLLTMPKRRFKPFDTSAFLDDDEVIAEYLTAALEDRDPDVFLTAISQVAKARGIASIAARSGLGRESLYKALAPGAKPRYDTVLKVLQCLGVKVVLKAA